MLGAVIDAIARRVAGRQGVQARTRRRLGPGPLLVGALLVVVLVGCTPAADAAGIPQVETTAATGITQTSATLNGVINPDGSRVTACEFRWDTNSQGIYQNSGTCDQAPATLGSGTDPVSVTMTITGLTPGTTYHFVLLAATTTGSDDGADLTFTTLATPPDSQTGEASGVSGTSATLTGTVNAEGAPLSDCHFDWGTSNTYGQSVPCSLMPAGTSSVVVSAMITGLAPGATYHFRLSATNAGGTGLGGDLSFTTPAPLPPPTANASPPSSSSVTSGHKHHKHKKKHKHWRT